MWGIILGVVGVGLALYELWTRDEDKKLSGSAVANAGPLTPVNSPVNALNVRQTTPTVSKQQAWVECNVSDGDLKATATWTSQYFGPAMPFLNSVALMRSISPVNTWPAFARRTECYLRRSGQITTEQFHHWNG